MPEVLTIKVLAVESQCNTIASNFSSNGLIRVVNIDTAPHLITVAFANGLTYGTTTLAANTEMYIQKNYTDLLSSNNAAGLVLATPIKRGSI
jgi:hypothetical protein